MNSKNMPGFTAENSLYKTSGHYQTGRHAINSSTQMISAIYPTATKLEVVNVPGEEIHIVDHWPPDSFTQPWTPPSWGGHTGPGMPVPTGPGGGGGGVSGGTGRPRRPRRLETLGDGPKYSQIRDAFDCNNAGVGAMECHSCSDTAAGRTCICYYCNPSSDSCTVFYDCTDTYGKTG